MAKPTKEEQKAQQKAELDNIILYADNKISTSTEAEIKSEMKLLVLSLIRLVGEQRPELLDKNTPEEDKLRLFFKFLAGSAMEAVTASAMPGGIKKLEKKYEDLLKIWPLLTKYSNAE